MAYSKGYKVRQDHAVGYQSLNRELDNCEAIHDAWAAKHIGASSGWRGLSTFSIPAGLAGIRTGWVAGLGNYAQPEIVIGGQHDDYLIPRAVTFVNVVTTTVTGVETTKTYPALNSTSGAVASITRQSEGVVWFQMARSATFGYRFGQPQAHASTSTSPPLRICNARVLQGAGAAAGSGLTVAVYCWERDAGSWILSDFGFSISIFTV